MFAHDGDAQASKVYLDLWTWGAWHTSPAPVLKQLHTAKKKLAGAIYDHLSSQVK